MRWSKFISEKSGKMKKSTVFSDSYLTCEQHGKEDDPLPGFRFHPTDAELVGFYLRRQIDKKPLRIDLIKQLDIYKFDPWDLPRAIDSQGDKEGYFFCKRGRKYKNSIRPNRVTGSGFWKATGIDKPVESNEGECIGLKKTLVYYRGSAGKGTKTSWMMHEFRLPPSDGSDMNMSSNSDAVSSPEAEVWTLCRIFMRNGSGRQRRPEWREQSSKSSCIDAKPECLYGDMSHNSRETLLCFSAPAGMRQYYEEPTVFFDSMEEPDHLKQPNWECWPSNQFSYSDSSASLSISYDPNATYTSGNFYDLRPMMDFGLSPSALL